MPTFTVDLHNSYIIAATLSAVRMSRSIECAHSLNSSWSAWCPSASVVSQYNRPRPDRICRNPLRFRLSADGHPLDVVLAVNFSSGTFVLSGTSRFAKPCYDHHMRIFVLPKEGVNQTFSVLQRAMDILSDYGFKSARVGGEEATHAGWCLPRHRVQDAQGDRSGCDGPATDWG